MIHQQRRFGTFEGVFTPTLLSIVGIVLFLRLGWVVGSVGLKSALLIIVLANLLTLFTGLSIASIVTNISVGPGGAYAIIAKSLGLSVGGAIGIPLYLSQAVSVAFYITGFAECWRLLFPASHLFAVSIAVWAVLLAISYLSTRLAFSVQYVIMGIIGLSLASALMGGGSFTLRPFAGHAVGGVSFWTAFAVFFPAVTGILAGASMSGELRQPARSIPIGTLAAIGTGLVIYVLMAYWFAASASAERLAADTAAMITMARWQWVIIAGIMGAALSSALSMFVAAPRTLAAMGTHEVVPLSAFFTGLSRRGEPVAAVVLTAAVSLATLLLGTLDKIALLLTMFFLITYCMLNFTVFIEQGIGIISFRPSFRIPSFFSLLGGVGCLAAIAFINPVFGAAAVVVISALYVLLLRREVGREWPDIRQGLFNYIAERSLKVAARLPYHPKVWKPNLAVPVKRPKEWVGVVDILRWIAAPAGRVTFFTVVDSAARDEKLVTGKGTDRVGTTARKAEADLAALAGPLREDGLLVSTMAVRSSGFVEGGSVVLQTLRASFLPPNTVFVKLGSTPDTDDTVCSFAERINPRELGLVIFKSHPREGFGKKEVVNLWVRMQSPNVDLAVLIALQLSRAWNGRIRLLHVIEHEENRQKVEAFLDKLKGRMRLPRQTELLVVKGAFLEVVGSVPPAGLNLFGLPDGFEMAWLRMVAEKAGTSVLFLKDSRYESAIA